MRVGLADMEPGIEVLRDKRQALPFRAEYLLLRGADPATLRVHRDVGGVPVHNVDQVKVRPLGAGQGGGQRNGVGAAVAGGIANYVSACMNPLWVCGRSQLCSGGSGRRRPVCVPAVVGTTLAQRGPEMS